MKSFLVFIMLVMYNYCTGQNLVTNPGFEEFSECPKTLGDIEKAIGWSEIPGSSSDYFNKCYIWGKITGLELGVPYNFEGYRQPHSGNSYIGLSLYLNVNYNNREYIKNQLKSKLEKGKKYKVAFYVSLSDSSQYQTNYISFCFTSSSKSKTPALAKIINPMEALISCPTRIKITEPEKLRSKEWVKLEGEYIAQGGEEFLIIGSFLEDMTKKEYKRELKKEILPCKNNDCAAYYYIDDVSVEEVTTLQPKFVK